MTKGIRNPVRWADIEKGMTMAERCFLDCVALGEPCKLDRCGPRVKQGDYNTVRGDVIRFVVLGGDTEHPVNASLIHLHGAWIEDEVDLRFVRIPYVLAFTHCRFGARVRLDYSRIEALDMNNSVLGKGITAKNIEILGDIHLGRRFVSFGKADLSGARIEGMLDCTAGQFYNENGIAIMGSGMKVDGGVYMGDGFVAKGEVNLNSARILGNFDCSGGEFSCPSAPRCTALDADGILVEGEIRFGESKGERMQITRTSSVFYGSIDELGPNRKFSSKGEVRLVSAQIRGNLYCTEGKFNKGESPKEGFNNVSLRVANTTINGIFHFEKIDQGSDGIVNLRETKVSAIADDADSWKPFEKVFLDGLVYDRFTSNDVSVKCLIDGWLAKSPFSPQAYNQAAHVLSKMGQDSVARKILLAKEQESTKQGHWRQWWEKPFRWLWGACAGYGYALWRTMIWSVIFIAIGAWIFCYADRYHRIVPSQAIVQADPDYGHFVKFHHDRPTEVVPKIFPGHTGFTSLAYSLDVFIPFFVLHQESAWSPDFGDTNNMWKPSILLVLAILALVFFAFLAEWIQRQWQGWLGTILVYAVVPGVIVMICFCVKGIWHWLFADWWWLTVWYWLEIGAGWVLTSLFLLSVTGLLRPRQSGEKN